MMRRNLSGRLLGVLPNDQKRKLMMCSFLMRTVIVMFAATGVDSVFGESKVPGRSTSQSMMMKLGTSTIVASLW